MILIASIEHCTSERKKRAASTDSCWIYTGILWYEYDCLNADED